MSQIKQLNSPNTGLVNKGVCVGIMPLLRLHPLDTKIYYHSYSRDWIAVTQLNPNENVERFGSDVSEIMALISRKVLIPDIESTKEYMAQYAVGAVDHRFYRLRPEIVAKYLFSYDILRILARIEYLIVHCDYNISDDDQGRQIDGQKYLEIIPRDATKVYNYRGDLISDPSNEQFWISKPSFAEMICREIIVAQDTKWKLSKKYWEFRL